jgi:hypothetical protein
MLALCGTHQLCSIAATAGGRFVAQHLTSHLFLYSAIANAGPIAFAILETVKAKHFQTPKPLPC